MRGLDGGTGQPAETAQLKNPFIMKHAMKIPLLLQAVISLGLVSCSPVFSDLQSARTVGQGRVEVTPHYTSASVSDGESSESIQRHIGLQAAIGITPRFDIRIRYENAWLEGAGFGDGISILAVGPKVSLLENHIALSVPMGRALGEGTLESWQIHPTLILSLPAIPDKIDVTLAPKYLMRLCGECENFIAVNMGLAISSNLRNWAIRPEFGLLYNPGEPGHFAQFSVGVSKSLGQ